MSIDKSFLIPELLLDNVFKDRDKFGELVGKQIFAPDYQSSMAVIKGWNGEYFSIEFYDKNGRPSRYSVSSSKIYLFPDTLELLDITIKHLEGILTGFKLRKTWMELNNKEKFDEIEWRIESILIELDKETTDYEKAKEILTNYLINY